MKHLLLFFLFSGSLDSFSQVYKIEGNNEQELVQNSDGTWSVRTVKPVPPSPDTLRAELLITYTTHRMSIAHIRDGFIVKQDGKVVRFLTDQKKRFPPSTRLWGWILCDEKVLP